MRCCGYCISVNTSVFRYIYHIDCLATYVQILISAIYMV